MNTDIHAEDQLKTRHENIDDWLDRLREYSEEKRRVLDIPKPFSSEDHDDLIRKHRI